MVSILGCPQLAVYLWPLGIAALAPRFSFRDGNCIFREHHRRVGRSGEGAGALHPCRAGCSKPFPSGEGSWGLGDSSDSKGQGKKVCALLRMAHEASLSFQVLCYCPSSGMQPSTDL